jgi:hypothetical protein
MPRIVIFMLISSCFTPTDSINLLGSYRRTGEVQWLTLAFSKGPNRMGVSLPLPDERLCFTVFTVPDDGQSPETQ